MVKKSFSLIEIIVATILVLIVVSGLVAGVVYVRYLLTKERHNIIAVEYANSVSERLIFETDFDDPNLSIGNHTIPPLGLPTNDSFWNSANPGVSYLVATYQIDPSGITPGFQPATKYQLDGVLPSLAIDLGNPDIAYNDVSIPPSQGNARNDAGAYGGSWRSRRHWCSG